MELGARIEDEHGEPLAPLALVLETYSRDPGGKHACLELLAESGTELPDTPTLALHRGRVDLLERLLARDPSLLTRTFTHDEIFPRALGCHRDETLALHGTPLAGGTLLHLAVDYDELELARWLLAKGADPNTRAALDSQGFGGHTALFGCVVSQPHRVGRRHDDAFARLLLEHGATKNLRASLRKRLRFAGDETWHAYHDVTPLEWGQRFHGREWVNGAVMRLL
jgi:ankyrin repeat protein